MNWAVCIICGDQSGELRCPARSTEGIVIYQSFLTAVQDFKDIDALPVSLLPDFSGISAATLDKNKAKWHKSCHLKFAPSKFQTILERKRKSESNDDDKKSVKRRSKDSYKYQCVFCLEGSDKGTLHECTTMDLDSKLKEMAKELNATDIYARLSGAFDVIAGDTKYHNQCLTSFKNKHRAMCRQTVSDSGEQSDHKAATAQAFAELISYIETEVENGKFMHKLMDLYSIYSKRLKEMGIETEVNRTRLKEKILNHFDGDCQEQNLTGRAIVLVFQEGLQSLLKEAIRNHDEEALAMVRLVKSVRKDMFDYESPTFEGIFPPDCQSTSVPQSLKTLVYMLLNGPHAPNEETVNLQAVLTISQLIFFNTKIKAPTGATVRHLKSREPPLPLYTGLKIHNETRNKTLINNFYELGISVHYERVREVEDDTAASICKHYEEIGLVCPPQLRKGLLTIGVADNIDHNPSSTTAKDSFHGTGISQFQFPTAQNPGVKQEYSFVHSTTRSQNYPLPDKYAIVPQVGFDVNSVEVPATQTNVTVENKEELQTAISEEKQWINSAIDLLDKGKLESGDHIAWGAYHAAKEDDPTDPPGIHALLPLFTEKAASIAMIKHCMDVQTQITSYLNPGQMPIMAFDQPLYTLAKYVQWKYPQYYGEDQFMVMAGGMHIELAVWRGIGEYLSNSGWITALGQAGIHGAESFTNVTHLTRTRHGHQLTAVALAKLQKEAWEQHNRENGTDKTFAEWREEMRKFPTFKYWDTALQYELLALAHIRSTHAGNLILFVQSLNSLTDWFFRFDRTNYARWSPVHVRDLLSVEPEIFLMLQKCFVFPKTNNKFSRLPIDQAHEQNNKDIKGSGGAVGLTENPNAFRKWMVAGPEQAKLMQDFESQYVTSSDTDDFSHHDMSVTGQETFRLQVKNVIDAIRGMGNPFIDTCPELIILDSRTCVRQEMAKEVMGLEEEGKTQHSKYINEVLIERCASIHDPLKRNSVSIMNPKTSSTGRKQKEISSLKSDCSLFSKLYIASQHRGDSDDMEEFFQHENHAWPPSLSDFGKLNLPNAKSDLLKVLPSQSGLEPGCLDVKIFDGAAIVHALKTIDLKTFDDFANERFIPFIESHLADCDRVDIVWDKYSENSLKETTRLKRGAGIRKKVAPQCPLLRNFQDFLHNEKNKEELFQFLTNKVINHTGFDKPVYITSSDSVVCNGSTQTMPSSDHEEADTRMCLHLKHAIQNGAVRLEVRTVDTDVVAILVGIFHELVEENHEFQLWVAFGTGKHFHYIYINSICQSLGQDKSQALPVFHAYTGSDTTSQFVGIGKSTAWNTWKDFPEVTQAFLEMRDFEHISIDSGTFKCLEKFTCILYDKSTEIEEVNALRMDLFPARSPDHIPPTQAALLEHCKRVVYQASVWAKSLIDTQDLSLPEGYGWTMENSPSWIPVWSHLPEASKACRQLIKCGCKSTPLCSRKCKCKEAGLPCTGLCHCKGKCN